ncbi:MAG: PilC/PilY family type IV pilus protein, partial [Gammaproteobacteria bacterium]|nr:PilC/PilY family type IV pilus protein [Gammaproteobacteria bacterium]
NPNNAGTTGAESIEGSTTITEGGIKLYDSPVDPDAAECQKQFIIMLSDGEPTSDWSADSKIQAMLTAAAGGTATTCDGTGDGHCLDDLAKNLNEDGFSAYLGAADGTVNDVHIQTYTVGFDISSTLLQRAGELGGGGYKEARDSSDLLSTLLELINEIKGIDTSFAAPAVSVNAFNRTTHRSDLFFTLFQPSIKQHWNGNFKKYRLTFDAAGVPSIYDANNRLAVDDASGFFSETAMSYWTPTTDGADGKATAEGGAASVLTASRKIFTNLGTTNVLSATSNIVQDSNTGLTMDVLGIAGKTAAERTELIKWANGLEQDGVTPRRIMGDPLHGQPSLIQYGGTFDADTGAELSVDITAFVATNDGYLHAFDVTTGAEKFAFIPAELLPNLDLLKTNVQGDKIYGLDGTINALVKDLDQDGIIIDSNGAVDGNDKVYIYFGMRRGGSNYYGMDVTDRNNPVLMWTIKGGVDANGNAIDTSLGDYSGLGQTWSTPEIRKIKYQGSDLDVLIFGGGYDLDQDNVTIRTVDDKGRGIYIVNAMTGQLLFRIGPDANAGLQLADMQYSIPSDITAVDSNGDDYVDHLYVGDMGGQVFRIDISNTRGAAADATFAGMITGGRIANLAGVTEVENRRFYYPPDVALMKKKTGGLEFNLVISSGYRAHPTNKVIQDRIYMMRDLPISGAPTTYVTLTESNLFDTTENTIGDGATQAEKDTAAASLAAAKGWYISLNVTTGEKGLTKPLIFDGEVFFTTYEPFDASTAVVSTSSCQPPQGNGYLYHINLNDGSPASDPAAIVDHTSDDITCNVDARCTSLKRSGIPADPTAIMTKDGEAVCVSTECSELEASSKHQRLYWFQQ